MPSGGTSAVTSTSTPGAPCTRVARACTRRANRLASAREICSRVRLAPASGGRSTVAAYRAPSEAAATRVLRTCRTSATWRIPRNNGTRTRTTSTKSTTAAPRSVRRGRATTSAAHGAERVAQHLAQLWAGDRPQRGDQARGHHRDQHPAGHVAALVPVVPSLGEDYQHQRGHDGSHLCGLTG